MFWKRFLPALLCLPLVVVACLMSAALAVGSTSVREIPGDLDGDSELSAYDLTLYLQYLAGDATLTDRALARADLNGDGKQDESDVELLRQYLSGTEVNGMETANTKRVAYLPLDNRPVNKDRAIYLAQSVGIELVMPEETLYRTALDNMESNPDGSTIGNREALLAWMKEVDETCDAFVLSVDQALSGGLVGSRWLQNTDLSLENEIIDEIAFLCENNTVILFDTVMRLASTVNYAGLDEDTYNALRGYGEIARRPLTGNELTVENIVAGYRCDENGREIPFSRGEEVLRHYLASRERKLRLTDTLLDKVKDRVEFLYIGVDDSSPQVTIQTNEINYLTAKLGGRGVLSAATDELGLCCITRMATLLYGSPQVHLTYFGDGKDLPADGFDIGTLGSVLDTHFACLNVEETSDTKDALQIFVLTKNNSPSDRQSLLQQMKDNLTNGVPTVFIDASTDAGAFAPTLLNGDVPIGMLFGYSCWNTVANSVGIALSQGVSRYAYLRNVPESTAEANEGFLKSMTFGYIKDISYKLFHPNINGIEQESYTCSVPLVLRRLNGSGIVTSLSPYAESGHAKVKVSNFRYPWNRTFEMTFDIQVG